MSLDPLLPAEPAHTLRLMRFVERVRVYDPAFNEDLLSRACDFFRQAGDAQNCAAGGAGFFRSLDVVDILIAFKMDSVTVAVALLHGALKEAIATRRDIDRRFGPGIAHLVDGVSRLSHIESLDNWPEQAKDFCKPVIAAPKDIRVLLIKLADCLHAMRELDAPDNKRSGIARAALEIYAPLAKRLGIEKIQNELQDLAFATLYPDEYAAITSRLKFLSNSEMPMRILQSLKNLLTGQAIAAKINGRQKTPYSIWHKMLRKNIGFDQLSDIIAFRIMVEDVSRCYQTLAVIQTHFPMVPERFKDYIAAPKANHYRSLHAGIVGPENRCIEIQIRTPEMHRVAEFGIAAHWNYRDEAPYRGEFSWLRGLLDAVEYAPETYRYFKCASAELCDDGIFRGPVSASKVVNCLPAKRLET